MKTIACLATGPSLTPADCDYVRGKADFVIAINDAWKLAPWADVLFSSDRHWWRHYKGVPGFAGQKIGIGSGIRKANSFHSHPDIDVYTNTGYSGLDTRPRCLRNGRNSGYAALNLAVLFGATKIVLLGYNMSHAHGAHYFGDHPNGLTQNAGLYPGFRRTFDSMVEPLQAHGVEVINCTPLSSLQTFPVRDLRDVLADRSVAA